MSLLYKVNYDRVSRKNAMTLKPKQMESSHHSFLLLTLVLFFVSICFLWKGLYKTQGETSASVRFSHLSSWIMFYFHYYKKRVYFGTRLVLRLWRWIWFAMMSPWENSSWALAMIYSETWTFRMDVSLKTIFCEAAHCGGEGSTVMSTWCYFEEVRWEELCRWSQLDLISVVCRRPNSQWTVVALTDSSTHSVTVDFSFHHSQQSSFARDGKSLLVHVEVSGFVNWVEYSGYLLPLNEGKLFSSVRSPSPQLEDFLLSTWRFKDASCDGREFSYVHDFISVTGPNQVLQTVPVQPVQSWAQSAPWPRETHQQTQVSPVPSSSEGSSLRYFIY